MAQRFEHCQLIGSKIVYLGRDGLFEAKRNQTWSEFSAWDFLEKESWELVSVVTDIKGVQIAYFKRPYQRS